jgi:tryptophan-rich sensory protein
MKLGRLLFAIVISQLAGIIGSLTTSPAWYQLINKPSFSPPGWVFGPVWITLYLLMGISLYLIWDNKLAKTWFFVQLSLNALWSLIFFGMQNPLLAFIDIFLLWAAIITTMFYALRISKTAFYLLVPYILWVSFAAILNFSIVLLN